MSTGNSIGVPLDAAMILASSSRFGTVISGRVGRGGWTAAAGLVAISCHRTACRSADDMTR